MANPSNNKPNRTFGLILRFTPVFLAVVLWAILTFAEWPFLKKVADQSLFLFDMDFISDALTVPGGVLGMAGAFFTQMLCLPWLGALVWTVLLGLTFILTCKASDINDKKACGIALLPAAVIVSGCMSIGYSVFIMRSQDWFFAPLLGYILALTPVFLTRKSKGLITEAVILILWTYLAYPLIGVFALGGTAAAACLAVTEKKFTLRERIITVCIAVLLIVAVPLTLYPLYTTLRLSDCWMAGLPDIGYAAWKNTLVPFRLIPFMPVICMALIKTSSRINTGTAIKEFCTGLSIYAAAVLAVALMWFRDFNFKAELAMSHAVDSSDWKQVLQIYQKTGNDYEPTRTMVMYRDLAMIKLGRALESGFSLKDGGKQQKSPTQLPMAIQAGKQLYFHYGINGLCYRWCLEDAVEEGWSTSTVKYMAMLAILTGQQEMAEKYLDMLDRTMFHKKWADSQRAILNSGNLELSAPYSDILPLMCYEDNMNNDLGKCESLLIRHFTGAKPVNTTPQFDMVALFWAMRTQSIPLFWETFYRYAASSQITRIPRNVQEAAILYYNLEGKGLELPYSDEVQKSYRSFTQFTQAHPVRNMDEARISYGQRFGNTFFYFYYFVRDLQTY